MLFRDHGTICFVKNKNNFENTFLDLYKKFQIFLFLFKSTGYITIKHFNEIFATLISEKEKLN